MKISLNNFTIFLAVAVNIVLGDLIGYNRLANNVRFHYGSRQINGVISTQHELLKEIKALMNERSGFAQKKTKCGEFRRNFDIYIKNIFF